ncbi:hypothetical protein Zmor_016019 [Zophobas morio]|uniref:Sodium/potassium-transporting ATPase subunit beta-2 n=1 Tax=Zophobas morio TaxID=2755281 RepID=A0AA38IFH0_9CUCU|nr:hypothetical protein Zmor_016019 [Zophobas morio]
MDISRLRKILFFYAIFYATLIALFGVTLAVCCQTRDDNKPKRHGADDLIGGNPGLAFRPMPPDSKKLDSFLETYHNQNSFETVQNCKRNKQPDENKFCGFQVTPDFAPCTKEYRYGLGGRERGGPCIFLKLNKIFGWQPDFYTNATAPSDMPKHLRDHIAKEELQERHQIIWVDCMERFQGKFHNVKGYVSPLVAVHFERPQRGVLINIECKAWARNIIHDRVDRRGSVHFELMVD